MKWSWVSILALIVATGAAVMGWKQVAQLRTDNDALRAELQGLREPGGAVVDARAAQREQELQRLRGEAQDVLRLRSEVRLLRAGTNEAALLRAENQRLRAESRTTATAGTGVAPAPAAASSDRFLKENWTLAGYATPEAALVSAIWSMKEGNPKSYLDSLSPEEQVRLAKTWENKTEAEIIAKHQSDVAPITGVRVLDRHEISAEEMQMNVYIEGVGRMEKVSMKRIGNDWKFGGFIRPPPK